jgi:hypothetical protein
MFSGGEKKSFYKLNLVIGTIIIALKLKQVIHYVQNNVLSSIYAVSTLKAAKSSIFSVYSCFYRHVPCNRKQVNYIKNKDYRPLGGYFEKEHSDFQVCI